MNYDKNEINAMKKRQNDPMTLPKLIWRKVVMIVKLQELKNYEENGAEWPYDTSPVEK